MNLRHAARELQRFVHGPEGFVNNGTNVIAEMSVAKRRMSHCEELLSGGRETIHGSLAKVEDANIDAGAAVRSREFPSAENRGFAGEQRR